MTAGAVGGRSETPSNRTIGAVAILKVNHDEDLEFVDTFLPYVGHCLAKSDADVVTLADVRAAMEREFALRVPPDTLVTLLQRLAAKGLVSEAEQDGLYRPARERLRAWRLDDARKTMLDEHQALVVKLRRFAKGRFGIAWSTDDARDALAAYLDSHSASVVTAALTGEKMPRLQTTAAPREDFVVHRFVASLRADDPAAFDALEKVTKGHMLLDAMYFSGSDVAQPLAGLEVYLDGPFLMKVVGLVEDEIQAPAVELVRMLIAQGALPRCFEHTVSEIQDVIAAAAAALSGRRPLNGRHGDVVAYLISQGESSSDLLLRARRIGHELLEKGVQPVPAPSAEPAVTIDETRLERLLRKQVNYRRTEALQRDVDSLVGVSRIRRGLQQRQLAKSKAIFVTDNGGVFDAALRFLDQTRVGPAVPICLLVRPLTTLLWIQQPSSAPDLPRERLIADAYAANNPPQEFWHAYAKEIEHLKETGNVSDEDATFLRISKEASDALLDVAYGQPEAVDDDAVLKALDSAREQLQRQQRHAAQLTEDQTRLLERVDYLSERIAAATARLVFMLLLPAILIGAAVGPTGLLSTSSPLPEVASIACSALVGGLSVFFLIRGGSLEGCARFTALKLQRSLRSAMLRLLQLDP